MNSKQPLAQRAEYTHKYNLKTGRHGWLRLTPAYSVKIIEELLNEYAKPLRIFDPFCGTANTALSAAYHGHEAITTDINPFLVWLGKAKTAYYSPSIITSTQVAASKAIELVKLEAVEPADAPPLYNIERWWDNSTLLFLRFLKSAINSVTERKSPQETLLLVAFCRTLIELSNAAFNHQSMSFKTTESPSIYKNTDMIGKFSCDVAFVLKGATENPTGSSQVILGDSRNPKVTTDGLFDLIITSPPYVNRMSYIRELRPYMYWLNFLENGRDAGDLDWKAIGGTWGIATSRLKTWQRKEEHFKNETIITALDKISHQNNKNGQLLANYIAKYFDDIWEHFQALNFILAPSSKIHYIVGNSTFYGVLLPVEQIYSNMLASLGFQNIECRPIRKRNSKKELIEFDVTASWK